MPTIRSNGTQPSTPHEWRAVIRDWEASGQTQAQFCAERGLSIHVFRAQRYGKRRSSAPREAVRRRRRATFVPMRVVARPAGSSLALLASPPGPVLDLVLVGGRVVRVPVGFDEDHLARVIAIAEARTC
jgi:hypothetical protein